MGGSELPQLFFWSAPTLSFGATRRELGLLGAPASGLHRSCRRLARTDRRSGRMRLLHLCRIGHPMRRRLGSFFLFGEVGDLVFSFHVVTLQSTGVTESTCERGDSNPHGLLHWILSPARLPIPPLPLLPKLAKSPLRPRLDLPTRVKKPAGGRRGQLTVC